MLQRKLLVHSIAYSSLSIVYDFRLRKTFCLLESHFTISNLLLTHAFSISPLPPTLHPSLLSLPPRPSILYPIYQIQLLLWLMESKVVRDAIDGLIMARPSQTLGKDLASMSKEMKRMSLRRKASLAAGGKCTCGKCTKCIPSPSGTERYPVKLLYIYAYYLSMILI